VAEAFPQLKLQDLGIGMPGLTPICGGLLAEAAAVCFEDRSHAAGVVIAVHCVGSAQFTIHWSAVTAQQRRTYKDLHWATEMGAYGVAILIVKAVTGKRVIERSKKGTGFDYWIGETDDDELIFTNKSRLEVSGILDGNDNEIAGRMKVKQAQVKVTDHLGVAAYVAIVEFGQPKAHVEMT
jgi:hypothetical protein